MKQPTPLCPSRCNVRSQVEWNFWTTKNWNTDKQFTESRVPRFGTLTNRFWGGMVSSSHELLEVVLLTGGPERCDVVGPGVSFGDTPGKGSRGSKDEVLLPVTPMGDKTVTSWYLSLLLVPGTVSCKGFQKQQMSVRSTYLLA